MSSDAGTRPAVTASVLPIKLDQPRTYSPQTLRLASTFFSDFVRRIGSSVTPESPSANRVNRSGASEHASDGWDDSLHREAALGGPGTGNRANDETAEVRSWLSPLRLTRGTPKKPAVALERTESASQADSLQPTIVSPRSCHLNALPDHLVVKILTFLPLDPVVLRNITLVSSRFQSLAQSQQLWKLAFEQSRWSLHPHMARRTVTAEQAPPGRWVSRYEWERGVASPSPVQPPLPYASPGSHAGSGSRRSSPGSSADADPICHYAADSPFPVHWQTLFHSFVARHHLFRHPSGPSVTETQASHSEAVYCVLFAPPFILTGSRDRSIRVSLAVPFLCSEAPQRFLRPVYVCPDAHEGSVLSLSVDLDEHRNGRMVSSSSDGTAKVWNLQLRPLLLATGGNSNVMVEAGTLRGHEGAVLDAKIGSENIFTASKDRTIRVWDRFSLELQHVLRIHEQPINGLALHPDPAVHQVAAASGDGTWSMIDYMTAKVIRKSSGGRRGLACIAWEGDYIVTGDSERLIKLYSASTGELIREMRGHDDLVRSLAINLEYRIIVSGSYDTAVCMWDLDTGRLIRKHESQGGLVFGVALEGSSLISVGNDRTLTMTISGAGLPYLE